MSLLEQLQTDLAKIEDRFPPLYNQFSILEKYDVPIPDEVGPREFKISKNCLLSLSSHVEAQLLFLQIFFLFSELNIQYLSGHVTLKFVCLEFEVREVLHTWES